MAKLATAPNKAASTIARHLVKPPIIAGILCNILKLIFIRIFHSQFRKYLNFFCFHFIGFVIFDMIKSCQMQNSMHQKMHHVIG